MAYLPLNIWIVIWNRIEAGIIVTEKAVLRINILRISKSCHTCTKLCPNWMVGCSGADHLHQISNKDFFAFLTRIILLDK